jgi:release factor glutamine methyltransferase
MENNFGKEAGWILKEKYNGKATKQFYTDIKRLNEGEPLDYIIGFKEFLGCKIDLSKKPLIPRAETEFWTAVAIDEIKSCLSLPRRRESGLIKVLDIFAGSGCIGVAVLKHVKKAQVVFADIDPHIRANKRYKIIKSDLFKNLKNKKFDFILANPPYIPDYRKNPSARLRTILRNRIQKSVLKYEPKIALFGKADGLFYIKKFLKEAKKHLNIGGRIYMEFDSPQKSAIDKILKKEKYTKWEFKRDQYERWRYVVIVV